MDPKRSDAEEIASESGEERMAPAVDTSKLARMNLDRWKNMMNIPNYPDNYHQMHVPQVFDVAAVTYLLESKGIAPLVWGEMATLAYHPRTVPPKLFFIIRDNLFSLAVEMLTKAGLERTRAPNGGGTSGSRALHAPYVRFRLRQNLPTRRIQNYLQLFSASEIGFSSDSRELGKTLKPSR